MSNSVDQKSELRKQFLTMRRQMEAGDMELRSEKLNKILSNEIDWSEIKKVHCFLPIVDDNEPDLRSLITSLVKQGVQIYTSNPPAKSVATPVNTKLENFSLDQATEFDLIVAPMIAYDPATNHRLGFGGGFYDRLLKSQPGAKKIGVCFKEFRIDNLPIESHDQPLQKIFAV